MAEPSMKFAQALCSHFGLSGKKVMRGMCIQDGAGEAFSVTLTIALTPEDLAGIAALMIEAGKQKDKDTWSLNTY